MLKKITSVVAILFVAFSCDMYDLDINVDPNNPIEASVDLLLPSIQAEWADDYQYIHDVAGGVMGHTSAFDNLGFTQNTFDGLWRSVYLNEVADLDEYIKFASATDENGAILNPGALGVGQVLKAHIFSTMADLFGDVPFTEAAKGNDDGNVNPAFDDDAAVYAACLALVDEAITNLGNATLSIQGDLVYGGSRAKWLAAAYSLKLKMLMTVREASGFTYGAGVASEIATLIADHGDDMITDSGDDFAFPWNTSVELGQRHPWMGSVYPGDNSFSYITHQFMYEMLINHDPRLPYYFKRQTDYVLDQEDPTDMNTTPCSQNSACIYGYMALNTNVMDEFLAAGVVASSTGSSDQAYIAGFFGRDKGDPSGIPLDGRFRLAPGVFPMGGQFDAGTPSKISSSDGLGLGDGYTYFISAAMVSLWKIEAGLDVAGVTVDTDAEYANFLDLSFEMVEDMALSIPASGAVSMDAASIAAATQHDHIIEVADYITAATARWTAASTADQKMRVLYKEAWYSLWGSEHELYNSHRRINYPRMKDSQSGTRGIADIQYPTYRATSSAAGQRDFPIRWTYPISEFNLNSNLTDILLSDGSEGIFWDPALFKYN